MRKIMQKLIIIQRMVKARSKNYYENNKERMQEKTRLIKQRKRKKQNREYRTDKYKNMFGEKK